MRLITPQSPVSDNCEGGAGGYRALLFNRVTGLVVIGLVCAILMGLYEVSDKFETFTGQDSKISEKIKNYYPGVLGMLRRARTGSKPPFGQDLYGQDGELPGRGLDRINGF